VGAGNGVCSAPFREESSMSVDIVWRSNDQGSGRSTLIEVETEHLTTAE
jgi:hypothetical protein